MGFPVSTKRDDRDASEYHPNHSDMEKGASKTYPIGPQAASCQHTVLKSYWLKYRISDIGCAKILDIGYNHIGLNIGYRQKQNIGYRLQTTDMPSLVWLSKRIMGSY